MTKSFLQELLHPSEEFTPMPFWFFNDEPKREEIERQFVDFKEKGVDGLVLHPRIGIPKTIPYLSEAFFDAVRMIVEIAAGLDMKIVLYDEGMYPSGSAHGMVAAANPDFAAKGITLADSPDGREILAALPDGKWIVKDFTKGTIRGIHFGEDDGEADAPLAADILNPEAVALFIHLTHDRYYEALKPWFGTTVIGFFTDEPCALGRNAGNFREWADGMEAEIIGAGGKLTELAALFSGEENATTKLYHRLVKRHLRETFYGALAAWCSAHGIALIGHPAESDDVEEELYFHIPGQDLILRRVEPKTGGLSGMDSVQAKLSADIARHLGCRRNANECFGVCNRNSIPWYFTGEDMKWYLDWLGIRGVNLFIPHAFYYSVAGKRKEERPPDVGPHNIWWKHYRRFSDYIKRLSFLMTDSRNRTEIAVLCDNNNVPWREVMPLYENQISFHYLPKRMLPACVEKDGKLLCREYAYEEVLDPFGLAEGEFPKTVRILNDVQKIVKAVRQRRAADRLQTEKGRASGAEEAHVGLRTQRARNGLWAEAVCPDLRICPLEKEDVSMYLLSNEGNAVIRTRLFLGEGGTPLFADLWEGRVYQAEWEAAPEGKRLDLRLESCRTCLILPDGETVRRQTDIAAASAARMQADVAAAPTARVQADIAAASAARIQADVAAAPAAPNADEALWQVLPADRNPFQKEPMCEDWTSRFALIKREANKAVYEYDLDWDGNGRQTAFFVRGEEMVECFCNDAFAGVSFWGTHSFELGGFLQKGSNRIRLEVTGNAANIYADAHIFFGLGLPET